MRRATKPQRAQVRCHLRGGDASARRSLRAQDRECRTPRDDLSSARNGSQNSRERLSLRPERPRSFCHRARRHIASPFRFTTRAFGRDPGRGPELDPLSGRSELGQHTQRFIGRGSRSLLSATNVSISVAAGRLRISGTAWPAQSGMKSVREARLAPCARSRVRLS
jgi:hypothetical protein